MKEPSKLLQMMFQAFRWQEMLDKATEKEIDLKTIKELCYPENRAKLYQIISDNKYNVFPPRIARIPKDNGEFREVYVNEPMDRIVLSLINDCLCELFRDLIHSKCVSYQKRLGTQEIIQKISKESVKLNNITHGKRVGYKADFSRYFDNVSIQTIDNVFDNIEKRLGFEKDTEPVINILRRYYHQDLYFDIDGKLQSRYQGLKQGCSVASFLANVVLYELDEFMDRKYSVYYRYSDDLIVLDSDTSNVVDEINSIIIKYGIALNPKKVEPIYANKFVKFLGFNIKGDMITLSKNRVKKFQREIEKRSIDIKKKNKNFTGNRAKKAIIKYLYDGERCWASSALGTVNVEADLQEMNKFIMDCIRACDTGKLKIGGLGSVNNLPDRTILRGRGRNVKANREKTGYIENYLSVKCLSNNLKMSTVIFETTVRNMKG